MSESGCVKYRYLGKSGLKVSDVCLGTMTFGERKVSRSTDGVKDKDVALGR